MANHNRIPIPHDNLKARVAMWAAVTGNRQYMLARELGISKSMLSQVLSGGKSDGKYRDRIVEHTNIS